MGEKRESEDGSMLPHISSSLLLRSYSSPSHSTLVTLGTDAVGRGSAALADSNLGQVEKVLRQARLALQTYVGDDSGDIYTAVFSATVSMEVLKDAIQERTDAKETKDSEIAKQKVKMATHDAIKMVEHLRETIEAETSGSDSVATEQVSILTEAVSTLRKTLPTEG